MSRYPEAFLNRMQTQLGESFPAFSEALSEPAKKALHINTLKTGRDELSALLDLPLPVLSENPDGAPLPDGFNPNATPLHAAGLFYMQEATAQAPVAGFELPDAPVVLDLCAAPGGKSVQLAAKAQGGVLFSNEIVPSRAEVLAGNIERMGVTNAFVTNAEPKGITERLQGKCDAVLVDAPCAGEAMFRKDEQAVRDWSLEHVETCAVRQRAILEDAQKAGKVRAIGLSNFYGKDLEKVLSQCKIKPVLLTVECHPYAQQKELKERLDKENILLQSWFPLGQGDPKLAHEPLFLELADKYKKTPQQIILKWHIQSGYGVIPGSKTPSHIDENIDLFDFDFTDEEMRRIGELDRHKKYLSVPDWLMKLFVPLFRQNYDKQP